MNDFSSKIQISTKVKRLQHFKLKQFIRLTSKREYTVFTGDFRDLVPKQN